MLGGIDAVKGGEMGQNYATLKDGFPRTVPGIGCLNLHPWIQQAQTSML